MEKIKTQVVLPLALLKRLDREVKKKKRSDFVVEAIEEKLKRLLLQNTLESVAGIWKNRNDFQTDTDDRKYLKSLRETNSVRENRLKKAWKDG
ncbi:MAG: hypothetical protein ACYDBV_13305 [Nitrospiria bacterium]